MTIFNKTEDVPKLIADRLIRLAATYAPGLTLDPDYVWEKLLAAETGLEEQLRTVFGPREVLPTGADESEFEAFWNAKPPQETLEEPGYDYEPGLFQGETWGMIELRHKPIIAVHGIVFAYPAVDNTFFSIPAGWIRLDKKYGRINLVPATDTSVNLPMNAYIMQALGGGRTIPLMVQVRYRAGFKDIQRERPDVVDAIKRAAVLGIIDDFYIPQSGSISADGLSQSKSFDTSKFHDALDAKLETLSRSLQRHSLDGLLTMWLSPDDFNGFLGGIGQAMLWRKASRCPCQDLVSGAARVGCPICRSLGWFWECAPGTPSQAGVSGARVQRAWQAFGEYVQGDVVITIGSDTPLYAAGETDRVLMSNTTESFNESFVFDGAPLDFQVASLDRVFWLDPTGSAIIEGDMPEIGDDGCITWPDGSVAPPADQIYTLIGRKAPDYFWYKTLSQDRAHQFGAALPRKAVLRRFGLFGK